MLFPQVARMGVEPINSQRFKLRRFSGLRTVPCISSPGGTRTPDPLLVRELPSPLGHRTMLFQWTYRELHSDLRLATPVSSYWTISPSFRSGSRETRTRKRLAPPLVFKTSSSSSRMTSVLSCGSWNRTNGLLVQSQASLPAATTPHRSCSMTPVRSHGSHQAAEVGIEPTNSWFKARHHYQQRLLRISKSALRESNPPRQVGSLEPLPLGQGHNCLKRKERESNPQGIMNCSSRFERGSVASRLDLP
jgi:hypothetical protein